MTQGFVDRRLVIAGIGALAPKVASAQAPAGNGGPTSTDPRFYNLTPPPVAVRHHGVLIRTPSLDAALAFYGDGLGFAIADFQPRAEWARLASNLPIYIEASAAGRLPPHDVANSEITFKSNNLEATQSALRAAGAQNLSEAPYEVAVGRSIHFRDHAGIEHHLLQANREGPIFAEPRVYNTGFDVPVAAIEPTRALLERAFGFVPMTERYFPPSVPYLEADRSFAFMLHHHQPGSPDWKVRENPRSDDLGVWQVFVAADLRAAAAAAVSHGAIALDRRARRFPMGRRMAFVTPGGAPFEVWSWR